MDITINLIGRFHATEEKPDARVSSNKKGENKYANGEPVPPNTNINEMVRITIHLIILFTKFL